MLEPKEDIKERLNRSPGKGDAYQMLQWALDKHIKPGPTDGKSDLPSYAITEEPVFNVANLPHYAVT